MKNLVLPILLSALFIPQTQASYKVGYITSRAGARVVSVNPSLAKVAAKQKIRLRYFPRFLAEDMKPSPEIYQEYLINDADATPEMLNMYRASRAMKMHASDDVRAIVEQGPKENRINLTIVGDGYTAAEKEKFFADAKRTTDNLFTGSTFASYLPLFNVYAVFVASAESGIGDGSPKNTALKLYRTPKGSKRAIMCGNSSAADRAIAMAPATDYPILLANDNFYGGLGGQYAISTSSVKSGMIVLRHELGHNFGDVGEEYDGGQVYSGANYSRTPNVPWAHWAPNGGIKAYDAQSLGGEYSWKNLSTGGVSANFAVPSGDFNVLVDMSSVGWETADDVISAIDGQTIQHPGPFSNDREFFQLGPKPMAPGSHKLTFTENKHDGDNVLAFYRLYAYPTTYNFTKDNVGAFVSFSEGNNKVGYRPTHDSCLMRDMTTPKFCVVDKENMWQRFLARMSLIDDVKVGMNRNSRGKMVQLVTPKLQGLSANWYKVEAGKETELTDYQNKFSWEVPAGMTGRIRVRVKYVTPEVRKYSDKFGAVKDFNL
ncbi:MAG: hypothetical protein JST80_09900 [Bdellovibrionales bacterium]|nr:hypothetical protein [Bdellovibrionales bacterium]